MKTYEIHYTVKGDDRTRHLEIKAKDEETAKEKIGRRHGHEDGSLIQVQSVTIKGGIQ